MGREVGGERRGAVPLPLPVVVLMSVIVVVSARRSGLFVKES